MQWYWLALRENHGIFCSIVTYPVIPKDDPTSFDPTAVHNQEDIDRTIVAFKDIKEA